MFHSYRILPWLGCLGLCAAAGCSTLGRSKTTCNGCGPGNIAEVPTTYENYTPVPTLKPLPAPPADIQSPPSPSPPTTQTAPNQKLDFFEPANASNGQSLN